MATEAQGLVQATGIKVKNPKGRATIMAFIGRRQFAFQVVHFLILLLWQNLSLHIFPSAPLFS